jgi:hypothetical protein
MVNAFTLMSTSHSTLKKRLRSQSSTAWIIDAMVFCLFVVVDDWNTKNVKREGGQNGENERANKKRRGAEGAERSEDGDGEHYARNFISIFFSHRPRFYLSCLWVTPACGPLLCSSPCHGVILYTRLSSRTSCTVLYCRLVCAEYKKWFTNTDIDIDTSDTKTMGPLVVAIGRNTDDLSSSPCVNQENVDDKDPQPVSHPLSDLGLLIPYYIQRG